MHGYDYYALKCKAKYFPPPLQPIRMTLIFVQVTREIDFNEMHRNLDNRLQGKIVLSIQIGILGKPFMHLQAKTFALQVSSSVCLACCAKC